MYIIGESHLHTEVSEPDSNVCSSFFILWKEIINKHSNEMHFVPFHQERPNHKLQICEWFKRM